ncbi:MAG: hypothetical protein JST93_01415 [Acidobacteria bacterium]|nr:hypothetical protein [Acidobacteriota bacterium]
MMRLLVAALQILTLLAPSADAGLFSRKKKPSGAKYGVSRASQEKRTEKAMAQRQKNREKQQKIDKAAERKAAKSIEIRAKSTAVE